MCRLLAYAAPEPTRIADVIGREQCREFQHLGCFHDDGWGSMWVDEPTADAPAAVRRTRSIDPAGDTQSLIEEMRGTPSRARAFHLRLATGALAVSERNTHPFLADGIGLAHNGSIIPTGPLREMVDPDLLTRLEGDTDSELYHAIVRQCLNAGDGPVEAVQNAVALIRSAYPTSSLNAIIMTAETLLVVHSSSDAVVPVEEFLAGGRTWVPRQHDPEHYYRMGYLRLPNGAMAFSSTGLDQHGWRALPKDSVTAVDLATMQVTCRPLTREAEAA